MTICLRSLLLAAALLPLAACGGEAASDAGDAVEVKHVMEHIREESTAALNVMIDAIGADGAIDPAKLSEGDWLALEAASAQLRNEAIELRDAEAIVIAHPGEMIEGEDLPGAPSKADVQAQIDAAPQTFNAFATTLANETERMAAAIVARDPDTMWQSALRLDPTCVACHDRFWRTGTPIPD